MWRPVCTGCMVCVSTCVASSIHFPCTCVYSVCIHTVVRLLLLYPLLMTLFSPPSFLPSSLPLSLPLILPPSFPPSLPPSLPFSFPPSLPPLSIAPLRIGRFTVVSKGDSWTEGMRLQKSTPCVCEWLQSPSTCIWWTSISP